MRCNATEPSVWAAAFIRNGAVWDPPPAVDLGSTPRPCTPRVELFLFKQLWKTFRNNWSYCLRWPLSSDTAGRQLRARREKSSLSTPKDRPMSSAPSLIGSCSSVGAAGTVHPRGCECPSSANAPCRARTYSADECDPRSCSVGRCKPKAESESVSPN